MAERSRYDLFRRRIAPVALLAGLLFLGTRTCANEMADVTLRIDVGDAAPMVRAVRVELSRDGAPEVLAHFEQRFDARGVRGPVTTTFQLDAGDYRLDGHAELAVAGELRRVRFTRAVTMTDRAEISIDIARDLAGVTATAALGP